MHDRLIRLRFLFLIIHLLFLLMILIFKKKTIVKENGTIFLKIKYKEVQAENLQDELNEISNRYTIMFSLSTVLLTVEFLSFLGGFSMFIKWQNQISILCHFTGTCLLSFLIYSKWIEELFYASFLMCILLPFAAEAFPVLNYLLIKV